MKNYLFILLLGLLPEVFFTKPIYAQVRQSAFPNKIELPKIVTNSYGIALGASQGKYTTFEVGFERYWGQIRLTKPRTTAVGIMANINPFKDVGGITSHIWTRHGRFGPTFGASGGYYSNFDDKSRVAIGPTVGYRMLGVHLVLGYNLLLGDKTLEGVNSYYGTLRFYIPVKKDIDIKTKN